MRFLLLVVVALIVSDADSTFLNAVTSYQNYSKNVIQTKVFLKPGVVDAVLLVVFEAEPVA